LSVFGDGLQTRAFSYIGDIAPHIANCINIPAAYNQVINVGADKEYSVKELATTVMEAMDMKSELRHLPARNEVMHAYSDHSKAKQLFGDTANTTLLEGLKKMSGWAKKTGIKKSTKFENIELTEKLPTFWLED
jgi:UDP-glucose 4-epimerase